MKTLLKVGDIAPDFSLIGTDGLIYTLNQYRGYRAITVFFIHHHCPYVQNIEEYLREMTQEFHQKGVAFLGIHSTNTQGEAYEQIQGWMEEKHFPWRSLHDPTQQIARRYGATTTPHFFLFDRHRILAYSGRAYDPSIKGAREDLKESLIELLDLRPVFLAETDPIGSLIQWGAESQQELLLV